MSNDNPVIFVGAGPGHPDLITVAGRKALEQADLVVYAGSLVSLEMLSWCKPETERIDSAGMALDAIVAAMVGGWKAGRKVVRLHTGDPSLYGAVSEQFRALRKAEAPFRVIPGVSAAFGAAASMAMEYTLPEVCQTLIFTRAAGRTPVPAREDLASLAAHGSSLAIYLSATQASKVGQVLAEAYGPDSAVAVAHRVSWPDEQIVWTTPARLAEDMAQAGIDRQALILAGPGPAGAAGQTQGADSRLYDAGFSHGFRSGEEEN